MKMRINAKGLSFRELNQRIREVAANGADEIELVNVNGQRYIGSGVDQNPIIKIYGTPGNDLGAFMGSSKILVYGDCEDGVGNTMSNGEIMVYGSAGDIVGYSMRGGKIYIKGNAGYRVGIHLKASRERSPVIVIGGSVRDFLGEYMAGGTIVVLGFGVNNGEIVGDFVGTGIHGGKVYVRGKVQKDKIGLDAVIAPMRDEDWVELKRILIDYCKAFNLRLRSLPKTKFTKIVPTSSRPYGKTYALE